MDVLAETQGRIYGAITIAGPEDFSSPFPGALFPCLIWDHDGRFNDAERSAVARALLLAGCRYAVCGGKHSDAWEDAVDWEFVAQHPGRWRDEELVMTTSHKGERPDDVAFHLVRLTNCLHDLQLYLILHVGTGVLKGHVDAGVRKYARMGPLT